MPIGEPSTETGNKRRITIRKTFLAEILTQEADTVAIFTQPLFEQLLGNIEILADNLLAPEGIANDHLRHAITCLRWHILQRKLSRCQSLTTNPITIH